ncbi:MAG: DUF1934 domain-containing protein [Clostridia bacterium]|nr:DUF1934 domain-containing protein [Clostridia bacterium]
MTKKKVMIKILTTRYESGQNGFDDEGDDALSFEELSTAEEEAETSEMWTEGRLVEGEQRVELIYEESEMSGMGGSVTSVGFDKTAPGLITMMRTGPVSTALVFEEGQRHICVYNTPFSTMEVCTITKRIENRLLTAGEIELDYQLEIQGAYAERCHMNIFVHRQDPGLLSL